MGAAPYCKINMDCDQFFAEKRQEKHVNISFQNEINNVRSENHSNNNIISNKETADFYDTSMKNSRFNNNVAEIKLKNKKIFMPIRNDIKNTFSLPKEDFVLSSRNYNSIEKKRSADETCETKNKVPQERESISKINLKFKESEDINEKIDIKQSIEIRINQNEKEISLKSCKFNDQNLSKIESESKNDISKIEHGVEDINSNISIGLKSKREEREEIPRENPNPIGQNSQISCFKNNPFSEVVEKVQTNFIKTERMNSFEIDPQIKVRGSVLSNDSKPSKKKTLELISRREEQENEKKHFTISSDRSDQTWKKMKITSFIPYQKLLEADDSKLSLKIDDLIFHSELNIVTLPDSKNKVVKPFSLKFCVLTKNHLKHYKSKEAYFRLVQPTLLFPLNNVISCDTINIDQSLFKKDKTLKYFFFYVKYLFNEEKIETKTINSHGSGPESSKFNSRIVNLNEENKRIKGKKINLLPETVSKNRKMSDIEEVIDCNYKKKDTNFDFNNSLVFASFNKNIIDKWVCAINHFIKK